MFEKIYQNKYKPNVNITIIPKKLLNRKSLRKRYVMRLYNRNERVVTSVQTFLMELIVHINASFYKSNTFFLWSRQTFLRLKRVYRKKKHLFVLCWSNFLRVLNLLNPSSEISGIMTSTSPPTHNAPRGDFSQRISMELGCAGGGSR